MINRLIVLSALILAFAITIDWHLTESESTDIPDPLRNEPDLYMLNATIEQYDAAGQLQHTLAASRFTRFPLTDLTTMQKPAMSLAGESNDKPWKITAEEGRILPGSNFREEIVELWSNVLAIQTDSDGAFVNIQTNSLTVYPEREYAETDEKVFIDNEMGRTTAAGMKAFLDTGRFMFFSTPEDRVVTIYLPE